MISNKLNQNKSIGEQSSSLVSSLKTINNSNQYNTSIPKPSNYGILTNNEKEINYFISRYPSGIININDDKGGEYKNYQSKTNMTLLASKNINNLKPNPNITVKYKTPEYTIENFDNYSKKYSLEINFLFILCIIIIIWMNSKLFK